MSLLDDENILKNTAFGELDNTLRWNWIAKHATPREVVSWPENCGQSTYVDRTAHYSTGTRTTKSSYVAKIPIRPRFDGNIRIHENSCVNPEFYNDSNVKPMYGTVDTAEVSLSYVGISESLDNSREPRICAAEIGMAIHLRDVDFIPDYITFEPGTRIVFVDSNNDNINIPDCELWFVHYNPFGKFEHRKVN